ncbi:hypothetical protein [Aurantiacibacter gilvus]|uniref:LPXTG cell wall anchor domain-containing protein n=1 Tax=Aurantiacibacter gilvus TaxID=3139141 RepID=A0ABU9I9F1_9SPHN
MRETIAYSLMAFLVMFVMLLLLLWLRKRRRVRESIWGKPRTARRRQRPAKVDEDRLD